MHEEVRNRDWVKNAAIIFLVVILVLTFFSNTIMNRSLPEVASQEVTSGSIVARVRGTGTVQANSNTQVKMDKTRVIRSVLVKVGQQVEVGDVLFTLGEGASEEIDAAEEKLQSLQASYNRTAATIPEFNYSTDTRKIGILGEKLAEAESAWNNARAAAEEASKGNTNLLAISKELERAVAARQEAEKYYTGEDYNKDKDGRTLQDWKNRQYSIVPEMVRFGLLDGDLLSASGGYSDRGKIEIQIDRVADKIKEDQKEDGTSGDGTGGSTGSGAGGSTDSGTGGSTDSGTGGSTDSGTGGSMDSGTGGSTDSGTGGSTDSGTGGSTDSGTGGSTDSGTGGSMEGDTGKSSEEGTNNNSEGEGTEESNANNSLFSSANYDFTDPLIPLKDEDNRPSDENVSQMEETVTPEEPEIPEDNIYEQRAEEESSPGTADYSFNLEAEYQTDKGKKPPCNEHSDWDTKEHHGDWKDCLEYCLEKYNACENNIYLLQTSAVAEYEAALAEEIKWSNLYDEYMETITPEGANAKARYEAYRTAKDNYDTAIETYHDKKASNEVTLAGYNADLANIWNQIKRAQAKLDELLGGDDAKIVAKASGTIKTLSAGPGDTKKKDDIIATIEVPDMGYKMSFSVTNEQANRLRVGDTGTVSNFYWGSEITATLNSIEIDQKNPATNKLLTFDLSGNVSTGTELTVSVGQKSANYDVIVPSSSVRTDANGTYVLKLDSKNSPLGNRYYARRVPVEVLAVDDMNSALNADLSFGDYVITSSSTPLKNGEMVRLATGS